MKKIMVLFACTICVLSSGCLTSVIPSSKEICAERMEELLYEKYNDSFTVIAVGGTHFKDVIMTYASWDQRPEITFEAELSTDGEDSIFRDEWALRTARMQVEDIVSNSFNDYGIDVITKANFDKYYEAEPFMQIDNYLYMAEADEITIYLIAKDDISWTTEYISTMFNNIKEKLPHIRLRVGTFIIRAEDFEKSELDIRQDTYAVTSRGRLRLFEANLVKQFYTEFDSDGELIENFEINLDY